MLCLRIDSQFKLIDSPNTGHCPFLRSSGNKRVTSAISMFSVLIIFFILTTSNAILLLSVNDNAWTRHGPRVQSEWNI